MVLHDLLVEDLRLMDLLHELLHSRLVVQVPLALLLLKLRFLVPELHQDALVVGSLRLNLPVQMLVTGLKLADLFIREVDSPQYVGLRSLRAASRGDCNTRHSLSPLCFNYGRFACGAPTLPYIGHILLFSQISHRLWCEV